VTFFGSHQRIFLDSCIWIYFLEGHSKYGPFVKKMMQQIEEGKVRGIISALTFTEILTGPFRKGNDLLVHEYYTLLSLFPYLEKRDITIDIAVDAARIRGSYNLAAPDSLLLASALQSSADAFLTNDRKLLRFTEIKILLLDDFFKNNPPAP